MAQRRSEAVLLLPFMLRAASVLVLCSVLACCGTNPPAPSTGACAATLPDGSGCASATPSYATDIAPIVQGNCLECHFVGNRNSSVVLETQAQMASRQQLVETELYRCDMPPADGPPLTNKERQLLLEWLVCGAPDN